MIACGCLLGVGFGFMCGCFNVCLLFLLDGCVIVLWWYTRLWLCIQCVYMGSGLGAVTMDGLFCVFSLVGLGSAGLRVCLNA